MDRKQILEHLAAAERNVNHGMSLLDRQRDLVQRVRMRGQDPESALTVLRQLEATHELHIADRDRLRTLLSHCRTPDPPSG